MIAPRTRALIVLIGGSASGKTTMGREFKDFGFRMVYQYTRGMAIADMTLLTVDRMDDLIFIMCGYPDVHVVNVLRPGTGIVPGADEIPNVVTVHNSGTLLDLHDKVKEVVRPIVNN